jgi:hypothetical protein
MLVFWLIDLALIAHLARIWQDPKCTYDLRYKYMCVPYLLRRDDVGGGRRTSFNTYYGALVAGALLAASEL